jgi:hypothetical protein
MPSVKFATDMNQLLELQYFGCIASFSNLFKVQQLFVEREETFQKMSFRNRCQILGAGKVVNLSVPVTGGRDQKAFTKDITIDNTQKWQVQHWRTLESCYNKSAFFMHYGPEVKNIIFGNHTTLWDLDEASLRWAIKKIGWKGIIAPTTDYQKQTPPDVLDYRNKFSPANRQTFDFPPYYQVFNVPFESNLSILDLLFNLGPQAGQYLAATTIS